MQQQEDHQLRKKKTSKLGQAKPKKIKHSVEPSPSTILTAVSNREDKEKFYNSRKQ